MKTKYFIFLSAVLMLCSACETQPLSLNYHEDTTQLWPAFNATNDSMGYINAKGKMVIKPKYRDACFFSAGLAKVYLNNGTMQFIDKRGHVVYTCAADEWVNDYFVNGYVLFHKSSGWGMYDTHFNEVIPPINAYLCEMSRDGFVYFASSGYTDHGFMNLEGDTIHLTGYIPEEPFVFKDGLVAVETRNGGRHGALNTKGELVFDTVYSDLCVLGAGRLAYSYGQAKYGLMDTAGNIILESTPYYFHISQYTKDEVICVNTGEYNTFGWIDKDGRSIAGNDFYNVHDFCDGVAWGVKETKLNKEDFQYTWELYDLNGNLLLTADDYHPMTHFENGLCLVIKWNNDYSSARDHTCKYMYIDKKGNVVYSWTYSGYYEDIWKPRQIKRHEPQI